MLKYGAVTIDLPTGGVYGDAAHCPVEDLLESAQEMLKLVSAINGHGVWSLSKDYDGGCHLWTEGKVFKIDMQLEPCDEMVKERAPYNRPAMTLGVFGNTDRDRYWKSLWYEPLIGKVVDGKVLADTSGVVDLTMPAREADERQRVEWEAKCQTEEAKPKKVRRRVKQVSPQSVYVAELNNVQVEPDTLKVPSGKKEEG
jgi:hypothetical protein